MLKSLFSLPVHKKQKNMAKNLLKVWMADNTVTTDDKTDKIFVLETTRSVD